IACPTDPFNADSLDLATRAAVTSLAQTPYHSTDIDLLMYAGVYRSDFLLEPAIATILAGRLGCDGETDREAGRRTLAFDVFNGGGGGLDRRATPAARWPVPRGAAPPVSAP